MAFAWQKARREVGHKDDWLMTYADMITLLLCFFIILLPSIIPDKKSAPTTVIVTQAPPPTEIRTGKIELPFPTIPADEIDPPIVETKIAPPEPVEAPPPAPTVEQTGNRITAIEISSTTSFDKGSAAITDQGKAVFHSIATDLKDEKYKDYRITVEGHTDDTPIKTSVFPSNWELSTARASAVVQFFLSEGIAPQKLRAAGYADTFPKLPNRDAANAPIPDNQAQNRRVVIKLEHIDTL